MLPYYTVDYISEYLGYKAAGPRLGTVKGPLRAGSERSTAFSPGSGLVQTGCVN